MSLGRKIEEICELRGISARQLALNIDYDYSSLHNIVSGRSKNPSLEFYKKLQKFGININWLLTGEGSIFLDSNEKSKSILIGSNNNNSNFGDFKLSGKCEEIIRSKDDTIKSKEEIIKMKDELLKSKDELIAVLKKQLDIDKNKI